MAINITVQAGNQVEGMTIDDELESEIFAATISDAEKVRRVNNSLRAQISLRRAFDQDQDLAAAAQYVWAHSPRVD